MNITSKHLKKKLKWISNINEMIFNLLKKRLNLSPIKWTKIALVNDSPLNEVLYKRVTEIKEFIYFFYACRFFILFWLWFNLLADFITCRQTFYILSFINDLLFLCAKKSNVSIAQLYFTKFFFNIQEQITMLERVPLAI